jgi:hypothetical protein
VRLQQLHIHQLQSQVDKMGKLILKRAGNTKTSTAAINSTHVPANAQNDSSNSSSEKSEGSVKAAMPRREEAVSRNKVIVEAAKRAATQSNDTASIPARAMDETTATATSGWDSDSSGWSDTSWGASSSGGGKSPQMPKVMDLFTRKFAVSADEGSISDWAELCIVQQHNTLAQIPRMFLWFRYLIFLIKFCWFWSSPLQS